MYAKTNTSSNWTETETARPTDHVKIILEIDDFSKKAKTNNKKGLRVVI